MSMLLRYAVICSLSCSVIGWADDKTDNKAKPKPAKQSQSLVSSVTKLLVGEEAQSEADVDSVATHQTEKTIPVLGSDKKGKLQTLCADASGNILAIVGPGRYDNPKQAGKSSEVQVYSAAGKLTDTWKLDFIAQAINVDAKGRVYVAGSGQIARFDSAGKKELQMELPFISAMLKDDAKVNKQAKERKEQMVATYDRSLKSYQTMLKAAQERAKKKDAKNTTDDKQGDEAQDEEQAVSLGQMQPKQLEQIIKQFQQMKDTYAKRPIEEFVDEITKQIRSVHGVATSNNDVFVVSGETTGYGYCVWRMTDSLEEPKAVLKGLSGCCGQMDVQCCDDCLCVAENTKHRVALYDREGKFVKAFGKRGREGGGDEFGSCCNPMNTRPSGSEIYTAESEGYIKRFSKTGEFLGTVAKAKLSGGCKNVAVAAHPETGNVYFCDLPGSKILILSKKVDAPKAN